MACTKKTKAAPKALKSTCSSQARSRKAAGPKPNLSKLKELTASNTKQYLHSNNTTEKYDGYVKRGKEFLASFVASEDNAEVSWKAQHTQGLSGDGKDEIRVDETILQSDPKFHHAFDGAPIKATPQALTMFLAWKCFEQDNGKSTADGIHAAFIAYYDQM